MIVKAGSADVTTYFVLRKAADGTELTGATVTNIDIGYTRSGADHVAKQDLAALAAPDSAHADNSGIEVDATVCPGLYRIDWPDAAFVAGVREVILTVVYATAFTEHLRVELVTPGASRGVALPNFTFLMTLNRAPVTGATVTATIKKDAGAFAGVAGAVSEIGNGVYAVSLTAAEMTAQVVTLRFTAAGCDDLTITIPLGD